MPGWFKRGEWSGLALIAGGVILVTLSLGGYLVGQALDRAFGTGTLWSTVGLVVGTLIGFWDLYRIARWVIAQQPPVTPRPSAQGSESASPDEEDREDNHDTW